MRLDGSDNTDGSQDAWKWSDGSPWDFSPWSKGQPDNSGGNDNRVVLKVNGKFWDWPVTSKLYGVYKKVSGILFKYQKYENFIMLPRDVFLIFKYLLCLI